MSTAIAEAEVDVTSAGTATYCLKRSPTLSTGLAFAVGDGGTGDNIET
jgi:hypothetical protein